MENENNSDIHMDDIEIPARFPEESDLELPVMQLSDNVESLLTDEVTEVTKEAAEQDLFEEFAELEMSDSIVSDEILWQARTGLNSDTLCGAIETIIFMSDRPVSIQKLKH